MAAVRRNTLPTRHAHFIYYSEVWPLVVDIKVRTVETNVCGLWPLTILLCLVFCFVLCKVVWILHCGLKCCLSKIWFRDNSKERNLKYITILISLAHLITNNLQFYAAAKDTLNLKFVNALGTFNKATFKNRVTSKYEFCL